MHCKENKHQQQHKEKKHRKTKHEIKTPRSKTTETRIGNKGSDTCPQTFCFQLVVCCFCVLGFVLVSCLLFLCFLGFGAQESLSDHCPQRPVLRGPSPAPAVPQGISCQMPVVCVFACVCAQTYRSIFPPQIWCLVAIPHLIADHLRNGT